MKKKGVIGLIGGLLGAAAAAVGISLAVTQCSLSPTPPSPTTSSSDTPTTSSTEPTTSSSSPTTTSSTEPTTSTSTDPTTTTSSGPTPHEHIPSEWKYDSENHFKICIECEEVLESEPHSLSETCSQNATDVNKTDVLTECSICEYTDSTTREATEEELCDYMNLELNGKEFFDVFEPKELLINKGYKLLADLSDESHYGYVSSLNKICIYTSSNEITYPSDCIGKSVLSYMEKEVTNFSQIKSSISEISSGSASYSAIKLANDINLLKVNGSIELSSNKPVQLNLNGHTIKNEDNYYGYCIKVNNSDSVVSIINGTIQTPVHTGYDMNYSPACVNSVKAKTVRITGVTLNNKSERGYGYLDGLALSSSYKCKINNSTINSPATSIVIQSGNYILDNNVIKGNVSINGGTSSINNCNISVAEVDYSVGDEFISNSYVRQICDTYFNDPSGAYKTYIISPTDAVTILDRRSSEGLYSSPKVTVKDSTLTGFSKDGKAYGYGLRYIDLGFDTAKQASRNDIKVEDCVFPICFAQSALEQEGGYTLDPTN